MSNRKNNGSSDQHHQRSAEIHDTPAHAHLAAAETHGKQDHQTGHEHSRQAQEHNGQNHDDVALRANGLGKPAAAPKAPLTKTVSSPPNKSPAKETGK